MMNLDLPLWAEIWACFLLVVAGVFTLTGTLGLWRFRNFYQRMHGPTMGASMGTACIVVASLLVFSFGEGRPVVHGVLALIFILFTVPITTMMLARASLYRHRREGKDVPTRHRHDDQDANEIHPTRDESEP